MKTNQPPANRDDGYDKNGQPKGGQYVLFLKGKQTESYFNITLKRDGPHSILYEIKIDGKTGTANFNIKDSMLALNLDDINFNKLLESKMGGYHADHSKWLMREIHELLAEHLNELGLTMTDEESDAIIMSIRHRSFEEHQKIEEASQ